LVIRSILSPFGAFYYTLSRFTLTIDLLYSDEDMREYLQYSTPQIAECLNIPVSLVEYRVSVMEKQLRFLE